MPRTLQRVVRLEDKNYLFRFTICVKFEDPTVIITCFRLDGTVSPSMVIFMREDYLVFEEELNSKQLEYILNNLLVHDVFPSMYPIACFQKIDYFIYFILIHFVSVSSTLLNSI